MEKGIVQVVGFTFAISKVGDSDTFTGAELNERKIIEDFFIFSYVKKGSELEKSRILRLSSIPEDEIIY